MFRSSTIVNRMTTINKSLHKVKNRINVRTFTLSPAIPVVNRFSFEEPKKYTLFTKINEDKGLKKYMRDIYFKSGTGFTTTLVTSMAVPLALTHVPLTLSAAGGLYLANFGFSLYSIFQMGKLQTKTIAKEDGLYEEKNEAKELWYKLFSISNGISLAPLVGLTLATNPVVIPIATAVTIGTFGGASYVALNQKDMNLVKYQGPLIGGVFGLIGASLVQLGATYMGYGSFATQLDLLTTGASTVIFTGLVAADTQVAIKDYAEKKLDSVNVCTELLLDATNLFIDFIKIFSQITKKD